MSNTNTVPNTLTEFLTDLPTRAGWGAWDSVGGSVYEGVQNWSLKGDSSTAIGVWGNVRPYPSGSIDDEPEHVEWSIYVGDCVDPHRDGFETPEGAMAAAESDFPEFFSLAA